MQYRVAGLLTLALLGSTCAGRPPILPPALFPVKSSWTVPVDAPFEGPLVSDGTRVFVATSDGVLRAFDLAGKLLWKRTTLPGTSLAAGGEVLVARQPDGRVARLDPADGDDLWSVDARISGKVPARVDSGRVFVAGDGVAALDAADGRLAWGAPGTPAVVLPPVPAGDQVLVVEDDGTLRSRERETGLPLWARDVGTRPGARPGVDGRRIYVPTRDRAVLGLSLKNGSRHWRWRLGTDVDATPVVSGGTLLVASLEAVLYAHDSGNGHMLWRAPLPSRPLAGPLLVGSAAIVACRETDLVAFQVADGRALGRYRTPSEMHTAPLLVGDRLLVGLRDPWALTSLQIDLEPRKPGASPSPSPSPGTSPSPATSPGTAPTPSPSPQPSAQP